MTVNVSKVDWKMLRKQKLILLKVINKDEVNPKEKEGLEGILALLDHIQDEVVDSGQITEKKVFGKLD